jgi:hypothetical protein
MKKMDAEKGIDLYTYLLVCGLDKSTGCSFSDDEGDPDDIIAMKESGCKRCEG